MSPKVLYLCPTPTPYRNAEVDRVAQLLGNEALEILFEKGSDAGGSWSGSYPEKTKYYVLDTGVESRREIATRLARFLATCNPLAVIVGNYRTWVGRQVLDWCVRTRRRYCLRSDSNIWTDRASGRFKQLGRRLLLSPRIKNAWRCLVTGTYNRLFWRHYGMRSEQDGWWPQWIDYEHWESANNLRKSGREEQRRRYRIWTKHTLLYFGRLVPRKKVDVLCEAILLAGGDYGLVVAGRGESAVALREKYTVLGGGRIRFLGPVEPSEAPGLFSAVDTVAIASGASEPWAMVINESCAAGLPILCNRFVGAAGDLVEERGNGILVEGNDAANWARSIHRLFQRQASLAEMGSRSSEIIHRWRDRGRPEECIRQLIYDVEFEEKTVG